MIEPPLPSIMTRAARPGEIEQTNQVHLHDGAKVVERLVDRGDRNAEAGVVHDDVDSPEAIDRGGQDALYLPTVGHVRGDRHHPRALLGELFEIRGAARGGHDVRAALMEHLREASAESAGRSCDDGDAVFDGEQ